MVLVQLLVGNPTNLNFNGMDEQQQRKNEANNIASMLSEFSAGVIDDYVNDNTMVFNDDNNEEELKRIREEQERAEIALEAETKKSAQNLIQSALDLYAKKTGEIDYVKLKTQSDINTFSKILQQIEINEDAIREIMRELKASGPNPNMLRCLSDLQKTEIELWKMKSQYLTEIETSLKQVSSDVEMSEAVELENEDEVNSAKIRGSRDLMMMLDQAQAKMQETQNSETNTNVEQPKEASDENTNA